MLSAFFEHPTSALAEVGGALFGLGYLVRSLVWGYLARRAAQKDVPAIARALSRSKEPPVSSD